jgi:hypothetical protein
VNCIVCIGAGKLLLALLLLLLLLVVHFISVFICNLLTEDPGTLKRYDKHKCADKGQ